MEHDLVSAVGAPRPSGRILVIEDDEDTRAHLVDVLEGRGYAVRCAGDGWQALDRLRAEPPPDLILLDLKMPVMDGREFRRRQQLDPALAAIPVVVLAAAEPDVRDGTLGDVGYLQKPVEPEDLFAVLERFLTGRRLEVLVVEDEPSVLQLLGVVLRHQGCVVLPARGGAEAVEVYRRHGATIGVVLLDVQMPGMDGPETLAALRGLDPSVPCVFMSGHTGRYTAEELLALGAERVLPKPFPNLAELGRVLRRAARLPGPGGTADRPDPAR